MSLSHNKLIILSRGACLDYRDCTVVINLHYNIFKFSNPVYLYVAKILFWKTWKIPRISVNDSGGPLVNLVKPFCCFF